MSTPYWGQLPGPKIHKRLSEPGADDADQLRSAPASESTPTTFNNTNNNPGRQNLDRTQLPDSNVANGAARHSNHKPSATKGVEPEAAPDSAQPDQANNGPPQELPQRRRSKKLQKLPHQYPKMNNRASVQTAVTDSTYDEPDTPSFHPAGLAPRPPSYIRGGASGHQGSSGMQYGSSRRRSQQPNEYDEYVTATPPAAPEVPRAPPTSYRVPFSNGGTYQHTASGGAGISPGEHQSRRAEPPVAPVSQPGTMDVPLTVSASSTSERRKVFADDRSPLQRLELTLGSYTKEEKRARVEAAERRARERAALRAGLAASSTAPSELAPGPERRVSSSRHDARPPQHESNDPSNTASVAMGAGSSLPREAEEQRIGHRTPGSHRGAQSSQSYGEKAGPRPAIEQQPQIENYQEQEPSQIPKRNLSFRERAARDTAELPSPPAEPVYGEHAPASTSGGLSLSRSGSNKLRKHPPGDPWYHQRVEAERAIPSVSARGPATQQILAPGEQVFHTSSEDQLPINPPGHIRPEDRRGSWGSKNALGPVSTAAVGTAAVSSNQHSQNQPVEPMSPGYDGDEKYMPTKRKRKDLSHWGYEPPESDRPPPGVEAAMRQLEGQGAHHSSDGSLHHEQQAAPYGHPEQMTPGRGRYKSPEWLSEWEKATVGRLTGPLLDLDTQPEPGIDKNKAWWENGGDSRRGSLSGRQRRAEAFDGEYDDTNGAPTRFKPPLYLKCGPLIRYCGIRQDRVQSRTKGGSPSEREMWRGSIMIVTQDAKSSYEIAPTLRLFLQDLELLPPPPHHVDGELSPEYVDPIAGHPKLGRQGETLYVRPVEHLQEGKDLSGDETNGGLFEPIKSTPDASAAGADVEQSGSFTSRRARISADGEKMQKYKDVRGFRLHAERGCTFWRFNIEIELRECQQRIAYRINRGPAMAFWVPPQGQTMNMMFYSCNGFSLAAKPDDFSGPDPMWRDVLNSHQTQPFHVMIGGGDQIYNDCVAEETEHFGNWLDLGSLHHKHQAPFSPEMQDELEEFYLNRYCTWFSQGLFSLATSQIPMVNMFDDHDIFDGYGSYADSEMSSPVLCGLGAVAFKYYMLFQQQSIVPETEKTEPSLIMGLEPGPYINELSRSLYVSMGSKVSLLAVDARTERTELDVMSSNTWEKIMNRLYAEVRRGHVEHLLVLLGVPIAYPRLVWLENILTSRLLDPVKALGKTGLLGKKLNNIDGGVEVLDDLNDHWTAKNHKHERALVIEDLQDLAIDKSLRITILSGDVHLAAVGQFFSNPKLGLAKHKDPRYMPNIISSAIANAPPPDLMADVLNKRNKIHHFDKQTDEDMIPMFQQGVDGKPRNNKRLMPHRNWCSIKQWNPGNTPPPTPPPEDYERSPSPERSGRGPMALIRRLSSRSRSQSGRPDLSRNSVRGPRPPISNSGGGGFFRSLSRRRGSTSEPQPNMLTRTMSLGRGDAPSKGGFFSSLGRRSSQRRPDDGGINGQWGEESEGEDDYYYGDPRAYGDPRLPQDRLHAQPSGLRGGGPQDEYSEGDEDYFTAAPPRRAQTLGSQSAKQDVELPPTRPFHRTPTGLSTKQRKHANNYEVDLEGGLDICLNVEVNPKDPAGITVPYRLLVPKLFYEYTPGDDDISTSPAEKHTSGGRFRKLLSFRKKPVDRGHVEDDDSQEDDDNWGRR